MITYTFEKRQPSGWTFFTTETISDQKAQELKRRLIIDDDGSPLNDIELAEELGVSVEAWRDDAICASADECLRVRTECKQHARAH